jgi:hypothetical protein
MAPLCRCDVKKGVNNGGALCCTYYLPGQENREYRSRPMRPAGWRGAEASNARWPVSAASGKAEGRSAACSWWGGGLGPTGRCDAMRTSREKEGAVLLKVLLGPPPHHTRAYLAKLRASEYARGERHQGAPPHAHRSSNGTIGTISSSVPDKG